jgi:hypothetical protein
MKVHIKEWSNKTATIMTPGGDVIWTFSNRQEALKACREWHGLVASEPIVVLEDDDIMPCVA